MFAAVTEFQVMLYGGLIALFVVGIFAYIALRLMYDRWSKKFKGLYREYADKLDRLEETRNRPVARPPGWYESTMRPKT